MKTRNKTEHGKTPKKHGIHLRPPGNPRSKEAELDRQYEEGYRRMPETSREIEVAEAMARDSWSEWKW